MPCASILQNMMNDSFTGHYKTCNSWWSQVWCNTPSLTPQWIPFLTHHRTAVASLLRLPPRCTAVYRQAAASAGGHCRPGNPCKQSYSCIQFLLQSRNALAHKCYYHVNTWNGWYNAMQITIHLVLDVWHFDSQIRNPNLANTTFYKRILY